MLYRLILIILYTFSLSAHALEIVQENDVVNLYKFENSFKNIRENLDFAIENQGLKISSVMHLGDMIHRTAPDLEFDDTIYDKAEAVEFCSAYLAHLMIQAHPINTAFCPLTILIYTLQDEPEIVYVAYRKAAWQGENIEKLNEEYELLMQTIIEELEF